MPSTAPPNRYTAEDHREAVIRGAAYLDSLGKPWANNVDVEELDLDNCTYCVLGQLYGNFDDAIELLDLSPSQRAELGFELAGNGRTTRADWEGLTQAWKDHINERMDAS